MAKEVVHTIRYISVN